MWLKGIVFLLAIRCMPCEKRAHAQIAHLVFADTQANAKKPNELFFNQRLTIMKE